MLETALAPIRLTPELVHRHDVKGPRYTSYPTADRFSDAFGADSLADALAHRAMTPRGERPPLSLYVHVPFCESVCYYCACNKVVTRDHRRAASYLRALGIEAALVAGHLRERETLSQLHLGGGTPTFLSDAELGELMATLRQRFDIAPTAELSIEIDPRTVDRARLAALRSLGFDRVSFGVQDFDPDVQRAVHRQQPYESVEALMTHTRALGFASVNVDLIHGLPRQTPASFAHTVRQVIGLRPDRVALYAYAHLPQRFKPQRRIAPDELPDAPTRVATFAEAVDAFERAGYVYIGMDHFALPHDALAIAKAEGGLHRNFQGYTTQPECDLIGLGVSAIGQMGSTYAQNVKTIPAYVEALGRGELPVERGVRLTRDDERRRAAILAVMCQGRLDGAEFRRTHGVAPRMAFADAWPRLGALAAQGLIELDDDGGLRVTPTGWYFVRAVAMAFDAHLAPGGAVDRFSKVV